MPRKISEYAGRIIGRANTIRDQNKDYSGALRLLEDALNNTPPYSPDDPQALNYHAGVTAFGIRGMAGKAETYLKTSLSLDPGHIRSRTALCDVYIRQTCDANARQDRLQEAYDLLAETSANPALAKILEDDINQRHWIDRAWSKLERITGCLLEHAGRREEAERYYVESRAIADRIHREDQDVARHEEPSRSKKDERQERAKRDQAERGMVYLLSEASVREDFRTVREAATAAEKYWRDENEEVFRLMRTDRPAAIQRILTLNR